MQSPATVAIMADRWTPFVRTLQIGGLSLTSATISMQVRQYYDAPGSALVSLSTVGSPSTEGIYIASATELSIRINEWTMEDLPAATEVGDDLVLYYDIHITPSGGVKQVYVRGTFTVRGGATQ
jgi:hypothetical protein